MAALRPLAIHFSFGGTPVGAGSAWVELIGSGDHVCWTFCPRIHDVVDHHASETPPLLSAHGRLTHAASVPELSLEGRTRPRLMRRPRLSAQLRKAKDAEEAAVKRR